MIKRNKNVSKRPRARRGHSGIIRNTTESFASLSRELIRLSIQSPQGTPTWKKEWIITYFLCNKLIDAALVKFDLDAISRRISRFVRFENYYSLRSEITIGDIVHFVLS
jgi:hypothetical protein